MAKTSKTQSLSPRYKPIAKLTMPLLILLTVCVIGRPAEAKISIYTFDSNQSTVIRSGGIAGIQKTLSVAGQFRLTIDSDAGLAAFEKVDANLTDETGSEYGQSLNEIFNMTGLAGTIIDDTTIQFEGKTADGIESDVRLKLSLKDDSAHLTGNTTPPPNSADMFFYDLDAVAARKYDGGTGETNDPYQIATAPDLIALGETPEDYDKHFILTADIDLDPNLPGRKVFDKAVIAPDTNNATEWFQGTGFAGVLDGNDHAISHLTIQGESYLGLFGSLEWSAEVKNLGVVDVNIVGLGSYVGGLVGRGGTVTSCYGTGVVGGADYVGGLVGFASRVTHSHSAGEVSGRAHVGGLVGINWGDIVQCHSTAAVNGERSVGGLVGNNDQSSVTECYSTGVVSASEDVGGLVGTNWWSSVTQCYSTSMVSGQSSIGGLVGWNVGSIADCYVEGIVTGGSAVGGLTGTNGSQGLPGHESYDGGIVNCCSASVVTGTTSVGGLVGANWGEVSGCFWDVQTSGQPTSDGGTGLTTAEMQTATTFLEAGWDFVGETENGTEDIWWILEGQDYPRLWWEQVLSDDFEDGQAGSLWFVYEPDMSKIWVEETSGRLEVYATARADDIDAAYVSNGWRLDVTKDFELKVDFHYGKLDVGDSWVMVGLLPSLAEPISRIITFEAGCMNEQPFYQYEAIDGSWRHEERSDRSSDDGTLYVSYDAGKDELYLSHTGYGKANTWRTVTELLKNKWAAQPVYVAIGGGSDRVVLDAGDAYLDNFVVDSGLLNLSAPLDDGTE
jgi:hypothetical protein